MIKTLRIVSLAVAGAALLSLNACRSKAPVYQPAPVQPSSGSYYGGK